MNNHLMFLLFLYPTIILVLATIPYLTRKTENFGVSIPESMYGRDDFKAMRKKYSLLLTSIGLLTTVILFIIGLQVSEATAYIIYSVLIIVFIIGSFLLYLPFHFKMKQIKQAENWQAARTQSLIIDTKFHQEKLTHSNWWFTIPVLITLATITITFILYDVIPEKLPMHTDFSGKVTYSDKSIGTLLLIPGSQVFLVILFIFINVIIRMTKQQVSVENPDKSKRQGIIFRRRWSAYLVFTSTLTAILLLFTQLSFIYPSLDNYHEPVIFTITAIIMIVTLALAFTTGQGGSRVNINDQHDESVIDRDDDRFWKLGQFYVNRNDPSIFVEKRFGVGWTNNWAHPLSWVLVGALILVIVIPILLFS